MPSFTGERTSSTSMRTARIILSSITFVALAGCTSQTQDNFTTTSSPASCTVVPAVAGCTTGSVSYSCAGGRPDDGNTDLVCDRGAPGPAGGVTLYCCAPYAQWASECTPATDVPGCGAQGLGFSCLGSTAPDQADTSLVCSAAIAGDGGARDYCCVSFDQASSACRCSSFDQALGTCGTSAPDAGCGGASIGFTCAPGHAPSDVNPLLECGEADGGAAAYCCQVP